VDDGVVVVDAVLSIAATVVVESAGVVLVDGGKSAATAASKGAFGAAALPFVIEPSGSDV
jgi:hypothetical protein